MTAIRFRAQLRSMSTLVLIGALATLTWSTVDAATPGLPFTEDFADTALRDDTLTSANWSPDEQAVYLAWSQRRQLPAFSNRQFIAASHAMRELVVGDVDGDGDLDAITIPLSNQPIRLLINDGGGVFSSGGNIGVGDYSDNSLEEGVLGDVDGDGDLDLIVGGSSFVQPNLLYVNDGSGAFSSPGTEIGGMGDQISGIALGDVDGDGDLDLITGDRVSTNKLFLNDGSGGFPGSGLALGSESDSTLSIALGDIDRDGDLDVIAGNDGRVNRLYLNDGVGGFPATGIAVGSDTSATSKVILGDVDGDGDLDVITRNNSQNNMLYLNDGSGGFPAAGVSLGFQSRDLILADVDDDGDPDLFAVMSSANPVLYLNDRNGNFVVSGITLAVPSIMIATGGAAGDLDGDGDMDLLTIENQSPNGSWMLVNNLDRGGFAANGTPVGSETDATFAIAMGDLDGDGDLDVLASRESQPIKRYLNDGSGGFPATGTNVGGIDGGGTYDLVLGDLDSDGDLDLITASNGDTNKRFLNDGSGGFSTATAVGNATNNTESVVLGDIDRDGDLDLIAGNSRQTNKLYLNDGLGGFPATGTNVGSETDISVMLALGDLNGDGYLDLVVGNRTNDGIGTNKRYLNDGFGGFSATGVNVGNENDETYGLVLGDLDGDGDLDVISGNFFSTNKRYLNDGSGNFSTSGTNVGNAPGDTVRLALGDVDSDGDLDLVASKFDAPNLLYLNNGSGGFPSTGIAVGGESDSTWSAALGDLDGDGDLDLVVGNLFQTNKLYMNGSRGAFRPPVEIDSDANTTQSVAIGDVDHDGDLDLIVGNNGQTNKLYVNNGEGQFPLAGIAVGSESDATFSVVLGDVNRDGTLDLIAGNSGQTNKLYLNGPGGFAATGIPIGSETDSTRSVALGDLDRDGDLDLVVGNTSSQTNKRYQNNGSGGFSASGTAVGSSNADSTQVVVLGDVNHDGYLDVVAGNASGQTKKLYLNNGSGGFPATGSNLGNETVAVQALVLGDLNGDGALDVVAGAGNSVNRLYLNDGSGGFPSTGTSVNGQIDATQSLTLGDLDADGDLDLIVGNSGQRNRLYLNNGSGSFAGTGTNLGNTSDLTRSVALADFDNDGDLDLFEGSANTGNKLHRFASFNTTGTATSTTVSAGESMRAVYLAATSMVNTSGTRNTGIDYFVSNDGGVHWLRIYSGQDVFFPSSGTDLRWKAELGSLSPAVTPMLTQISLTLVPTVPEAPTIAMVSAGDASAEINFGVPANNGSWIIGYNVTSAPGNLSSSGCTDSPCTVSGLTNGAEYTFTVTATNGVGTGPASAPSGSVTPRASQVIDFGALPDRVLGDPPFMVSASGGGSGNAVTFASLTTLVCTTSGSDGHIVTLVSLGTCTVRASQAGSSAYAAAADVDQSFAVTQEHIFQNGFD